MGYSHTGDFQLFSPSVRKYKIAPAYQQVKKSIRIWKTPLRPPKEQHCWQGSVGAGGTRLDPPHEEAATLS